MKQHNRDWSDIVAQRVTDHKISPKGDIWQNLEIELKKDLVKAGRTARVKKMTTLVAAMAAVVAAIFFSLKVDIDDMPTTPEIVAREPKIDEPINYLDTTINSDVIAMAIPKAKSSDIKSIDNIIEPSEKEENKETVSADKPIEKQQERRVHQPIEQSGERDDSGYNYIYRKKGKNNKVELQIYGSGALGSISAASSTGVAMVSTYQMAEETTGGQLQSTRIAQSYSYKHHQPIKFGISAAKGLAHNLHIGSGVTYGRYGSTATNLINGKVISQHIDMIGVPLFLNWGVIEGKVIDIYIGGEVEAQWAIAAQFDGDNDYDISTQISSSLHAGAALNLTNKMAIYVEPKFSHYFTKTQLPSIINDKDIIFNLKVGLKYNF